MTTDEEFKILIDAVREFSIALKKSGNGNLTKISNKDLLFFFINKCSELDKEMDDIKLEQARIKSSVKTSLILVTLLLSVFTVIMAYIRL
jgi:hypothetical protein